MAYIHDIFKRFLDNEYTQEELSILLRHFELNEYTEDLHRLVEKEFSKPVPENEISIDAVHLATSKRLEILRAIENQYNNKKIVTRRIKLVSIAASILLVCSFTFVIQRIKSGFPSTNSVLTDIEPGTNRATLILENGQSIALKEENTGISMQNDKITYTDGTQIVDDAESKFVRLVTPRKGMYKLILPDGSLVWLNAASSLRYPTAFGGTKREVELQGEAYFEVVSNTAKPFIVKTDKQQLQVLGTVFNVNAYANEPDVTTTLVSGKVALKTVDSGASTILNPDEQASLGSAGYRVKQVNSEAYTAWTSGEFRFVATPLPEVIRQIERWYDLDVDYNRIPENVKIHASIRNDKKLSSVLYVLERMANIKLKIEGRRLQVMSE